MSTDPKDAVALDPDEWHRVRTLCAITRFAPMLPLATLAGCVAAILCASAPSQLLIWFEAGLACSAALAAAALALHRTRAANATRAARACRQWLAFGAFLTGIFWGTTSVMLLRSGAISPGFLALTVAAVVTLWLPLFALQTMTFFVVAAPSLLPMALMLSIPPTAPPLATIGSLLLLLFSAFLAVTAIMRRVLDTDHAAHCALHYRATHDTLVGLTNRAELHRRIAAFETSQPGPYAIVFVDLDHFKAVNDTAGHGAGDQLCGSSARSSETKNVNPTSLRASAATSS